MTRQTTKRYYQAVLNLVENKEEFKAHVASLIEQETQWSRKARWELAVIILDDQVRHILGTQERTQPTEQSWDEGCFLQGDVIAHDYTAAEEFIQRYR